MFSPTEPLGVTHMSCAMCYARELRAQRILQAAPQVVNRSV